MEEQSGQGSSPETKVFIGDLVFENETDFQKISETIKKAFKNPEAIADVKVNPNRSKMGFSYAFVTFRTAEDARKAVEAETITINRNTVRVEKFAPRNDNQIYIRDIGSLTREALEGLLARFGKITNIHIFEPNSGVGSKACNVMFEKQEDAENCLRQHEINAPGVVLRLERSTQGKHEGKEEPKLFLRKIPFNSDKKQLEAQLSKQLEKYGKLAKPVEIEYKETNFGTAVITYEDPTNMEKAKKEFNKALLGNELLLDLTDYQTKKDRDSKGGGIYISHLLPTTPLDKILERVGHYGAIENHSIYMGETRNGERCKRGTITFENKDSVTAILSDIENPELSELFLNGETKINIFLDKADRMNYMKAVSKPNRSQNNPPFSAMFPIMGYPGMPGMMPMMIPGMSMPGGMGGMPPMGPMPGMPMGNMQGMGGLPGMIPMHPAMMGQPSAPMMNPHRVNPRPAAGDSFKK